MKAIIIKSSSEPTLNPLLYSCNIDNLSVMGTQMHLHRRNFLALHNIADTDILKSPSVDEISRITDDPIVLIEENLLTNADLTDALLTHQSSNSDITLILRKSVNTSASHPILINKNNLIIGIEQTPSSHIYPALEAEGIYILSKSIILSILQTESIIDGEKIINFGISSSLNIIGYISHRHSITISSTHDYRKAHNDALFGALPLKFPAMQIKPGFFVENGAYISSGVKIETPLYVSCGCHIERGAKLGGGTFISKNCVIKSGASVYRSIIGEGCCICEGAQIEGAVLANGINVGRNTKIMENSVIGYGCRIEPECTINANVRIWPNKRILKGTRLNDNLIYGSIGTEKLFKGGRVCGEINVEITPEFMAKLGSAIGTSFQGRKIGVSFDSSPMCEALSSACIAGIISSGARVFDFGEQSLPMTRIATSFYSLDTSIHISPESKDGASCPEIEFIEPDGASYCSSSEKLIENTFFNNIFLRANSKQFHEVIHLKGYKSIYIQEILNNITSHRFEINMELRTPSETISDILENLFSTMALMTSNKADKVFSAEISSNGEDITVFSSNGSCVGKSQLISIISMILLRHLRLKTIVLPAYAPSQLEKFLKSEGCEIICCGTSRYELMHVLLKNKLYQQFRMCFDGIYLAVTLLDFLNCNSITFDSFLESLPSNSYKETEVECPDSRKNKIIENLYSKYEDSDIEFGDGIKIYQTEGFVLIIPEKYRHYIKIITEADTMEAAEEISVFFTNQIKKLAKPQ